MDLQIVIVHAICMIPPFCPLMTLCVLALEDGSLDRPLLCLNSISKAFLYITKMLC